MDVRAVDSGGRSVRFWAWPVLSVGLWLAGGAARAEEPAPSAPAPGPVPAPSTDPSAADATLPTITFSNLVVRLPGEDADIGFWGGDMRVLLTETLRHEGFRAVGAESLVFARDDSAQADFALGGTLREAACDRAARTNDCCRVGVDWELLDMASDEVVYRHRSRYGECHLRASDGKTNWRRLAINAMRSLVQREAFLAELRTRAVDQLEKPYAPAKFARCKQSKLSMPKSSHAAIDSTVIVQSGKGHGSGFFLSSSGLVMTAAHVLQSSDVTVKMRDGVSYRARPLRISRKFDVALLAAELPSELPSKRCLAVEPKPQPAGTEVYAIGAPASQDLGFSLTRGIVSGLREKRGVHYLQTDAPVSPGNSGGPLVDANGRVLAVVVSKLAGQALEGIAFGIPIDVGLGALGIAPGDATDAALTSGASPVLAAQKHAVTVDPPDPPAKPTRDQGRVLGTHTFPGTKVVQKRDATNGFGIAQGWFYIGTSLELYMLATPKGAPSRVALRLQQGAVYMPSELLQCEALELIVNGRRYAPLSTKIDRAKSGSKERVQRVESQFELAALRRVREHAPTVSVRACAKQWTFSPSQVVGVQSLLNTYDSIAESEGLAAETESN